MWERVLQVVAFLVFYAVGIAFLFIGYDTDVLLKEDDELNAL